MKKNTSKFICLAIAPLMALCSCDGYLHTKDWTMYLPLNANICMRIYDENEKEIYKLDDLGDYSITLMVEKTYVVYVYNYPMYGVYFEDEDISFEYDSEYLNIENYDPEEKIDNKFCFTGLKETEETTMVIRIGVTKDPKTMKIALVAPEIDEEESESII